LRAQKAVLRRAAQDLLTLLPALAQEISRGGRAAVSKEGLPQVSGGQQAGCGIFGDERVMFKQPAYVLAGFAKNRFRSRGPAQFDLDVARVEQGQGQAVAKLAEPRLLFNQPAIERGRLLKDPGSLSVPPGAVEHDTPVGVCPRE